MATHHVELVGIVLLLVFAATMFYQGTMILHQHRGYSQRYIQKDMENMRRRVEDIVKNAKD